MAERISPKERASKCEDVASSSLNWSQQRYQMGLLHGITCVHIMDPHDTFFSFILFLEHHAIFKAYISRLSSNMEKCTTQNLSLRNKNQNSLLTMTSRGRRSERRQSQRLETGCSGNGGPEALPYQRWGYQSIALTSPELSNLFR